MKILVVSDVPWDNNNNIGNTYSNIFENMKEVEFASLYCKSGEPKSKIPTSFYQMTEKKILLNLFRLKIKKNNDKKPYIILNKQEEKILNIIKCIRLTIFFIVREVIWQIGKWKTKDLDCFLVKFKPDIVFSLCLDSLYYCNILQYCIKKTNANLVLFFVDDIYTYKKYSPLYLVYKFIVRKKIKYTLMNSKLLFGITDELCCEYSKLFKKEVYLLHKICNKLPEIKNITDKMPLVLTYTGNLYYGRWKTLAILSEVIKKINKDSINIFLYIYSSGTYDEKIKNTLNIDNASQIVGSIPYKEIKKVLSDSDLVVHVESFDKSDIKNIRFSFSTKILDYIESGSCIFAIGPENVSSIKLLKNNNMAHVVTNLNEKSIEFILLEILKNRGIVYETSINMLNYANKYCLSDFLFNQFYSKLKKL